MAKTIPIPEAMLLQTFRQALKDISRKYKNLPRSTVADVLGNFVTDRTGFYTSQSSVILDESHEILLDRLMWNYVESKTPMYIVFPILHLPVGKWPYSALEQVTNCGLVRRLYYMGNSSFKTKTYCMYDRDTMLVELCLGFPGPVSEIEQFYSSFDDNTSRNTIMYCDNPETSSLASNLEHRHCVKLTKLLQEWVSRAWIDKDFEDHVMSYDVRSSIEKLLRKSNLPPERLSAELRSLADEIDPKPKPLALPDKAPELFAERENRREPIEDFLRRVWMPWIESGALTRVAFRKLDPKGETAFSNRFRQQPPPPDVHLPTVKEVNDRAMAAVQNVLPEAERLAAVKRRRLAHQPKKHNP